MTDKLDPSRVPIPAQVFGSLLRGEIRIILLPGSGLANGGAPRDLPVERIPFDCRMPNTLLWVRLDSMFEVVAVWRRAEAPWDAPEARP